MTKNVNAKTWAFTGSPRATYNSDNLSGEYIPPTTLLIDSYEYATIPIVRTDGGTDYELWYHNDVAEVPPGTCVTDTANALFGTYCLKNTVTGGTGDSLGTSVIFYNNNGGGTNNWRYLRDYPGFTELKKYNRMRFWAKFPSSKVRKNNGSHNFHFGTYCRNTSTPYTSSESDNWHFYHYYDVGYSDNWQQFIVDMHPNHQRSAGGGVEHGVKTDLETGYDYFDLMTWVYFEDKDALAADATFYFDKIELYEETFDEDEDHIYSLTGVKSNVVPNQIEVTWSRDKTEDSKTFDVKYAFTSFYENGGWSHGTAAPAGTGISPMDIGGYNLVEYVTTAIDLTGQDVIYIAVKHQDETTRFRQIAIPLTAAGYQTVGG